MRLQKKRNGKKWILPVIVFFAGIYVMVSVLRQSCNVNKRQLKVISKLNATTYAERLKNDMFRGVAITDALKTILISEKGNVVDFQKVAENLNADFIQSIQIAPNGFVKEIFPEAGNEAGKMDLLNDEKRGPLCRYGRDNKIITVQGPFNLKQGGQGIAIRNPVYLDGDDGEKYFWGFAIVIIRVPDVFADSITALSNFGYDYSLSKTVSPLSDETEVILFSKENLDETVSYDFEFGGCKFKLSVMPVDGWNHGWSLFPNLFLGICVILFLTGLTAIILVIEKHKEILKKISMTDSLTGLLNRKGFEEQVRKLMEENPGLNCVGIQMDIDDFKFINDMYGHMVGDTAIEGLARSMQEMLGENAILARNGGDEFSAILVGTTEEEAREKIEKFTMLSRAVMYNGEEHPFFISLGYAEFPKDCDDVSELIRCADMALYAVKLHGKHNCSAYQGNYRAQHRSQLGFALQDISKNLPGAFLIYTADKDDDNILFANRELIEFALCKDFDDFLDYTDRSFRNLIRPDERDAVEQSIWKQINAGESGPNDYVRFHLVRKDGTCHQVLDHGRIVNNRYYGNVFYVLIMDCALVESYYEGKIGG